MTADFEQKVDELFEAALELPAGSRKDFLDKACDGDQKMLREVSSLLRHHQVAEEGGFLNRLAENSFSGKGFAQMEPNGSEDPAASSASKMEVSLSVVEGPNKGHVFKFREHDTFIVGRGKQSHCRLPKKDPYFSRIHFMVEVNPPCCRLVDMNSSNGTKVNGREVSVLDLHDGDTVSGGDTVFRVSIKAVGATASSQSGLRREPQPRTSAASKKEASTPSTAVRVADKQGKRLAQQRPNDGRPEQNTSLPPESIAGYRIVRELGRGGMGVVYLAESAASVDPVAVKTITPAAAGNSADVERFFRESNVLRDLDHPNIVKFCEMGESEGRLYFVMEYVEGVDAKELLRANGPLPVNRAVSIVCQMLEALDYAHRRRFVHRDIKPANLLIARQSGSEIVKLADFGLARVYHSSRLSGLTMTGDLRCSVPFVPPEQITDFREAKPFSDIYAAGATLYYLLTGKYIYDFPERSELRLLMILQDNPIPITARRSVPNKIASAISRSLAREPADRFVDAAEMRETLLPFCEP